MNTSFFMLKDLINEYARLEVEFSESSNPQEKFVQVVYNVQQLIDSNQYTIRELKQLLTDTIDFLKE